MILLNEKHRKCTSGKLGSTKHIEMLRGEIHTHHIFRETALGYWEVEFGCEMNQASTAPSSCVCILSLLNWVCPATRTPIPYASTLPLKFVWGMHLSNAYFPKRLESFPPTHGTPAIQFQEGFLNGPWRKVLRSIKDKMWRSYLMFSNQVTRNMEEARGLERLNSHCIEGGLLELTSLFWSLRSFKLSSN